MEPSESASLAVNRAARLARWAIGLGVAGLVAMVIFAPVALLFAVPSVVCGHKARTRFKALGESAPGRGLATAGLLLGYLPLVGVATTTLLLSAVLLLSQPGEPPTWLSWIYELF